MIKRMRGSISVLLALILVPVLTLSDVLLEIGRYRSANAILDEAALSAAMSVLGYFDSDLFSRFSLYAMDEEKATADLYKSYLQDNTNHDSNQLSSLYEKLDVDFSTMYSLGDPYVLTNQIRQAEEYRAVVTFAKDREPLETLNDVITSELLSKQSKQQLERFEATTKLVNTMGKFGESIADSGDAAKALEEQITVTAEKKKELDDAIDAYDPEAEDSGEDDEDDEDQVTAEDVEAVRDAYCEELKTLRKNITAYINKYNSMQTSMRSTLSEFTSTVSKYQGTVVEEKDDQGNVVKNEKGEIQYTVEGGEEWGSIATGLKNYQSSMERYGDTGITELKQVKTEIDSVITWMKEESAEDFKTVDHSAYEVTVRGNIAYGDWKELLVTVTGDSIGSYLLEFLGQLVWVLSYTMAGTECNDYQFDNYLSESVWANTYEHNPVPDPVLNSADTEYIQELLKKAGNAANQLGYDLSKLDPENRTSNLGALSDMDDLVDRIVSNMMKIVEFVSQLINLLNTTSLGDVFMLAYKLVKLVKKAAAAMVAGIALVTTMIELFTKFETFWTYMKQSLADGFYLNAYCVNMFPNRTTAVTGKSQKGASYSAYYTPTMSEAVATSYAYARSYGLGAITDDLLKSRGIRTVGETEADMFAGACVEYIINGSRSECENQTSVYDGIFLLRVLANLPAFFLNKETKAVMNIPYVGPVIFLIWFVAECNMDMKFLTLSNSKLRIVKGKDAIFLSTAGLKQIAENVEKFETASYVSPKAAFTSIVSPVKGSGAAGKAFDKILGLDYQDYCWLLLCMVPNQKKVNRIADLVEMEMKLEHPEFSMRRANTCLRADVHAEYHRLLPVLLVPEKTMDALDMRTLRFAGY